MWRYSTVTGCISNLGPIHQEKLFTRIKENLINWLGESYWGVGKVIP